MADWIDRFAGLADLDAEFRRVLLRQGRVVSLPSGAVVFAPGRMPEHMLLLLDGAVRVQQVAANGREIVLYRVRAGESCILTTACLLAGEDYAAEGLAETATDAVLIPRATFDDLMARSPKFQRFVFTAFSGRITDLLTLIQEVAFARVDLRLAQKLIELSGTDGVISRTHQQLATEIGTAREVVSRQLHEFQRQGWIVQSRGAVRIADRGALQALALAD